MNRRLLLLCSIAAVLAIVLLIGRTAPPTMVDPTPLPDAGDTAAAPPPVDAVPLLNPLEEMTPGSFAAILQRPLFNPGRTPRAEEAPPAPQPSAPVPAQPAGPQGPRAEDFKLVAISSGPTGRIAALRILASGEVLYLREGQPVEAWTVLAISETSVVIGTTQSSIELSLFPGGSGMAAPAPVNASIPPLSEEIEDANDAYHAATEEYDPYANQPPME